MPVLCLLMATSTAQAVAQACFTDPPAAVGSDVARKRPSAPKPRKAITPVALAPVPVVDPVVIRPKARPKPKPAPVAVAAQQRVRIDCPKDAVLPVAMLGDAISRPPPGKSALLAAAESAPAPTGADLKSGLGAPPLGNDPAMWPVAPVWQFARNDTALLSSGASMPGAMADPPAAPLVEIPPTNVPEPGTLSLLAVAVLLAAFRRRLW